MIIKLGVSQMTFVMTNLDPNVLDGTVLPLALSKQDIIFASQESMLMAVPWALAAAFMFRQTTRVHLYVAHHVIMKEDKYRAIMELTRMAVRWDIIVH